MMIGEIGLPSGWTLGEVSRMSSLLRNLEKLNSQFGIDDALRFERGAGDFVFAKVEAAGGVAEICLYGAHVTSFTPSGGEQVLWLSDEAVYRAGKAIRGGVPICWPWFSAHPSDADKPSHGFARISEWEVIASSLSDTGEVRLELALPGEIGCVLSVLVGEQLSLELRTTNHTDAKFEMTGALHTYLQVEDVRELRGEGLDGCSYFDDVRSGEEKVQRGDVLIEEEVDRRYVHADGDILLRDAGRTLRVSKVGSASSIVWNPWSNRAAEIGDMPDDGYLTMLCVEAGNAGADVVRLEPGASHVLGTTIGVV